MGEVPKTKDDGENEIFSTASYRNRCTTLSGGGEYLMPSLFEPLTDPLGPIKLKLGNPRLTLSCQQGKGISHLGDLRMGFVTFSNSPLNCASFIRRYSAHPNASPAPFLSFLLCPLAADGLVALSIPSLL